MEGWLQRIFLITLLSTVSALALGQTSSEVNEEKTVLDAVIEPDLDRRRVDEDKIDSEDFEFGIFSGVYSFEDFGSNNVFGYRMAYHISEDWFLEGVYGVSEIGKTSFESLSGTNLLTEDEREVDYYNVSLGVNLFPGEIFLGKNYAFNTNY